LTYVILEVKSEDVGKINKLTKDDIVSRQSVLTRDSSSLEIKGNVSYVKIVGFKKLGQKKAKEVDKKIEEQEDSAASGMGMIFD